MEWPHSLTLPFSGLLISQKPQGRDGEAEPGSRCCCCSVAKSCPTVQSRVLQHIRLSCPLSSPGACYNSCSWVMPSNHLILCRPLLLLPSIFLSIRIFSNGQFFTSGGQSIGVSASTSVLPMNIQDWFPLGWTSWISLQSKGLSRIFSNTTV